LRSPDRGHGSRDNLSQPHAPSQRDNPELHVGLHGAEFALVEKPQQVLLYFMVNSPVPSAGNAAQTAKKRGFSLHWVASNVALATENR